MNYKLRNYFLVFTLTISASLSSFAQQWQPLFNGKTLEGWHTLPGGNWKEINNDPGRTEGHIALQLHGDQDMLVSFKDIEIKIY